MGKQIKKRAGSYSRTYDWEMVLNKSYGGSYQTIYKMLWFSHRVLTGFLENSGCSHCWWSSGLLWKELKKMYFE